MTVLSASLLVWLVERDINPDLEALPDAVWWAVVTVTTVGYGDVVPATTLGRALAVTLMLVGIASLVLLVSILSIALVRREEEEGESTDAAARAAPQSVAGRLVALADLHDRSCISDEEYEAAKRETLAGR